MAKSDRLRTIAEARRLVEMVEWGTGRTARNILKPYHVAPTHGAPMRQQAPPGPGFPAHRLATVITFPLQPKPLAYALLLAISSAAVLPVGLIVSMVSNEGFVQTVLGAFIPWVIGELAILVAVARYGLKVMAFGSRGIVRAADFGRRLDASWKKLSWKFLALLLIQVVLSGIFMNSLWATLALNGLLMSLLPASTVALVKSSSLRSALNPAAVGRVVRALGWPYLALILLLELLYVGLGFTAVALLRWLGWWGLPAINLIAISSSWLVASLLGHAMHLKFAELEVEGLPGKGAEDRAGDGRSTAQITHQQADAMVAEMVAEGGIQGALNQAYEEQLANPHDLSAHRRYHRILLLTPDNTESMLEHARRLIALLYRRDLASEALRTYHVCRQRDRTFVLDDPVVAVGLSRLEWRNGDAKASLALLKGFDKRFRGHAAIPEAYELAARVLVQALDRRDLALQILKALESRYPESDQARDVRWLMRDQPSKAG